MLNFPSSKMKLALSGIPEAAQHRFRPEHMRSLSVRASACIQ